MNETAKSLAEFLAFVFAAVVAMAAAVTVIVLVASYAIDKPTCFARGEAMKIEASWGLYTGCMITLNGQKLPWSEVAPVQRGDKIVFEPKPQVVLSSQVASETQK